MSIRYIVPALAAAGSAIAASCSASTTTISSAADASALTSCTTFTGSIAIATSNTDNIALNGIQKISGDLIASNVTQMTQLSADSLQTITGEFNLDEVTILSTLSFPELTAVDSIVWNALPNLQGLSFTTGVQTASTLNIQNTELASLDGIDLQVVDTVFIANNPYLTDIEMQLGNITVSLIIESNGNNMTAVFPNMIWANNMTFRKVSTIDLASLEVVNGSLGFYENEFTSVTAANLTSVGSSLTFDSNDQLTNVSMPLLKTVTGGFTIENNTDYSVVAYPKLATVGGALTMNGNFTSISLPDLSDVKGAFKIYSYEDCSSACTHFKTLSGSDNVIKGTYSCHSTSSSGTGTTVSGSGTSTSGSASSTASSAASGIFVPTAVSGFMGVVAVLFGFM